jgi:Zn-dependent protease with chaperone function
MRRSLCFGLVSFFILLTCGISSARPAASVFHPSPSFSASTAQDVPAISPPNPQQNEPAVNPPVGQAASETQRYTLSHERYEKAVAYSRAGYTLYFVSVFLDIAILLLVLKTGFAARIRDFALRRSDNRFLQGLVFIPLLLLVLDVLDLPLRLYWHSLSLRYEQSVQRWGSWFWDWSKEELLSIVVLVLLIQILFLVIRKSPRRWWFYFWLAALPILFFIFYISPWFVSPLFNKFEPLEKQNPGLVAAIEKVAQRAGLHIPPERIFLMKASEKTNQINAYVTGVGASKRVVVWDTTIQKMTPNETIFIFGHEAGHYVLGHVRNGLLFFAAVLFVALYLSYRGLHLLLGRWGQAWKLYGPQDWASLAVFLLILQVLVFAFSPVGNGFSRWQEHEADVYGLEVIHGIVPNSSEVASRAFQVLGEIDLADPNPSPFITFWLYSHPPLADRLVFAHSYDPWSKGESPKFVK